MVKRPNRNLEVFSLSALDLFASAMGAFMIVTIILFPYYLNRQATEDEAGQIEATRQEAARKTAAARVRAEQLALDLATAEAARSSAEDLKDLEEEIAKTEAAVVAQKEKLASLAERFDRTVPFSILGIQTNAAKFVIAVDMSGSMNQYKPIIGETVARTLAPLKEETQFAMVGFHGGGRDPVLIHHWPSDRIMRPATAANKNEARRALGRWINLFGGKTPTLEALGEVLEYDPEAIILMSDGAPTSVPTPDEIVDMVTRENRNGAEIHSVAIGEYTEDVNLIAFLRDLASKNNGSFVGVHR